MPRTVSDCNQHRVLIDAKNELEHGQFTDQVVHAPRLGGFAEVCFAIVAHPSVDVFGADEVISKACH
jgi:hypothetical protein